MLVLVLSSVSVGVGGGGVSRDVSREGLAPIVKAYSRLIPVDGLVL